MTKIVCTLMMIQISWFNPYRICEMDLSYLELGPVHCQIWGDQIKNINFNNKQSIKIGQSAWICKLSWLDYVNC